MSGQCSSERHLFFSFFSQLTRSDQVLSLVSIVMGWFWNRFLSVVFLLCVEDGFVPIINWGATHYCKKVIGQFVYVVVFSIVHSHLQMYKKHVTFAILLYTNIEQQKRKNKTKKYLQFVERMTTFVEINNSLNHKLII